MIDIRHPEGASQRVLLEVAGPMTGSASLESDEDH
jgi:hypothetical protein